MDVNTHDDKDKKKTCDSQTAVRQVEGRSVLYLVCDAVEDFHGQVGHLREGICRKVEEDPPDLGVNAVEGHAWKDTQTHIRL